MGARANALATRLEENAAALAKYAEGLSDADWRRPMKPDGRSAGVIIHHVASVYPIEIQLAQGVGNGQPIKATWTDIHAMNAGHAKEHAATGKKETLELLKANSKAAAAAIRGFSDEQLDRAAPCGLNSNATLTAQFFLEDHAVRHSFHHLAKLREAFGN